jgi:hypothetical protein
MSFRVNGEINGWSDDEIIGDPAGTGGGDVFVFWN